MDFIGNRWSWNFIRYDIHIERESIMPRPSPRTGTTGAGIQKFGTQQLKYVDDDPSKGVIEKDVGARTRLFFGGEATTPKTPFSATYQAQRPATIRTTAQLATSPHAIPQFSDWELPTGVFSDLGEIFDIGLSYTQQEANFHKLEQRLGSGNHSIDYSINLNSYLSH